MSKLDVYAKAEIGKSLAGFKLGEKLEKFMFLVDKVVSGDKIEWNVDLVRKNGGILLYEWSSNYGGGYSIFFKNPKLELNFSKNGLLRFIQVGEGYEGEIFEGGIKIGSRIADINHDLFLDDTEDVHYLVDNKGQFIEGIFFVAGGEEVIENPDAIIEGVRVYNHDL